MSKGSIPIGEIAFYDNVQAPIVAGDYTINASQQVNSTDSDHPLSKTFTATRPVSVIAPRFRIPEADVQSYFPPRTAAGVFDQNLPHIVLNERVLPWERRLDPNDPKCPWMALLLFTEDEIIPPDGKPPTIANPTLAGNYPIEQLLHPSDTSILGPAVTPDTYDETSCSTVDITTDTFTKVTPRLAELPFLAHGREVNVGDKATDVAVAGGFFSVVIGNRFPATNANSPDGTRNIAHLVSLEGFLPYLVDTPSWPRPDITKVRLASLQSWVFTCKPEGGSFRQLMLALTSNQPKGGDTLRLRLPIASGAHPAGAAADLARKALQQGYAALQYETRGGEHTFAWYHGPFVPHPLPAISAKQKAFPNAAAATIYDQTTGTFDLTYAVAWELGRLLALSDRAYSTHQMSARKSLRKTVNLVRERTGSQSGARMLAASNSDEPSALADLLAPNHVSRSFVSWLGEEASDHLPAPGVAAVAPPTETHAMLRAARPAMQAVAQVRALHGRGDVRALLMQRVTAAAQDGPVAQMTKWLGKLRLLQGLPFVHLLADARMLPTESLRFFYVDPNYLDALCDGAASVGVHTSRDAAQQELVRPALRDAAIRHAHTMRAMAIGGPHLLKSTQPNDPVAGFILRSAAVSGWPGLEVKGYADAAGNSPIDVVRFDAIGSDVLLVLFAGVPARVEINEPKETLAFGVEDNNLVLLRDLSGTTIGKVNGRSATLSDTYKRGTTRVVNIASWQQALAAAMGSPAGWGAATFAIEMVRAPEQMIFQNQPDLAAQEVSRG
jgi:hypothetical protein